MDEGGTEYNSEANRAMRIASLLVVPLVAIYSLLIVFEVIPSSHYIGPELAITISVFWIFLSIFYYFKPTELKSDKAIRLAMVHIFAIMTMLFVTGFAQPLAPLFILLFLASHMYFGRFGLGLSMLSLLGAAAIDVGLRISYDQVVVVENGIAALLITFLGFSVISIISAQETKRQALLHSQRRERMQYERLLTIINNLTDAAFTTDQNGTIVMYNAACLDLLDTNSSIKGKNIGKLFTLTDETSKKVDLVETLKMTPRAVRRDDLNHTYKDGESIRLEATFAPIRSSYSLRKRRDEFGGFIVIMRDITKQKSLEDERDEFISVVSHELRTPITIVEGTLSNLDILMKQPQLPTKKVLTSTVTTAHDQVLYLAKMVNDLSTLSRAERGVADDPEEIDVAELLHVLHKRYEKEAAKHKLQLNLDLATRLGSVNVSRLYLEELLQNFITNAIKYTQVGSVTIKARRAKGIVTFSVVDTGIGISRTDQVNVFNKFYRSEDYRIRETSGTGLGLYVSAKLARKLDTTINLESRVNHGSTFSFELQAE